MSKRIEGNVEFIGDMRIVCGWVLGPEAGTVVRLRLDGKPLAQVRPQIVRTDIEGAHGRPTGFRIALDAPFTYQDVTDGRLVIEAEDASGKDILEISDEALDALRLTRALELLTALARPLPARLMSEMAAARDRVDEALTAPTDAFEREMAPETLSPVYLPVGLKAHDGSAALGRDGTLFLLRGRSDAVAGLYERTPERLAEAAAGARAWEPVFAARHAALGSRYLQLILPEKQSVQGRLLEPPVEVATPLFGAVCEVAGPGHLPMIDRLRQADRSAPVFRKVDTHLSTFGARAVISAVCERLGLPTPLPGAPTTAIRDGDLSRELLRAPVWERCQELEDLAGLEAPTVVEAFYPADRAHVGQRHVFSNPDAPHDLTVVCFGNSFMDRGQTSGHLTWWLARMFTRFHFVWDPAFDLSYIDEIRPDIVIGQTIERYLLRAPQT